MSRHTESIAEAPDYLAADEDHIGGTLEGHHLTLARKTGVDDGAFLWVLSEIPGQKVAPFSSGKS
jgi:hypothetical protein